MANSKQLTILQQGVEEWNKWREQNPKIQPDLREADLRDAGLANAKLGNSSLVGANLSWANLYNADLRRADFRRADLNGATLNKANLSGAKFQMANLEEVDLYKADLSGADLSGAVLRGTALVETSLKNANLTGCHVYGISAWNVSLDGAIESNLVITRADESPIQVDNLEMAQFIYLLLNNEKIRQVIDTVTSKVVLILGRFTRRRMAVLQSTRKELRKRGYLPVLFDFQKPSSRGLTDTVSTLAHMARFVIADITDAKSIPQELGRIVPDLPSVPVQPVLLASQQEYGMFEDFRGTPGC